MQGFMSKQNTIRWAVLGVLALAGLLIAVYAAMGYGHYHDYDECMYWENQDHIYCSVLFPPPAPTATPRPTATPSVLSLKLAA